MGFRVAEGGVTVESLLTNTKCLLKPLLNQIVVAHTSRDRVRSRFSIELIIETVVSEDRTLT
jgi:hypothetical protein